MHVPEPKPDVATMTQVALAAALPCAPRGVDRINPNKTKSLGSLRVRGGGGGV